MYHRLLAALAVAAVLASAAHAQTAEDVFGIWRHPENDSHVEMYACGENLCAKIVKVVDTQKSDDKNPDTSKRNRPVVGLVIIQGAKKTGTGSWAGSIYNRADGSTYSGTITVKDRNALDLAGCTAVILCKTLTWTRVK